MFLYSAGGLLLGTGLAKLVSATGSARILEMHDPILLMTFRDVLITAGALELLASLICFTGKRMCFRAGALVWLSTSFLLYRFALFLIGYHKPCICLGYGNVTDALHIPAADAHLAANVILGYLLIGSYIALFWLWRQSWKARPTMPALEPTASER